MPAMQPWGIYFRRKKKRKVFVPQRYQTANKVNKSWEESQVIFCLFFPLGLVIPILHFLFCFLPRSDLWDSRFFLRSFRFFAKWEKRWGKEWSVGVALSFLTQQKNSTTTTNENGTKEANISKGTRGRGRVSHHSSKSVWSSQGKLHDHQRQTL